jgi:hypothetical protein
MSYALGLIYMLIGAFAAGVAVVFNEAAAYPPSNRVLLMGVPPMVAIAAAFAVVGFVIVRSLRPRLSRSEYIAHSVTFAVIAAAGIVALLLS